MRLGDILYELTSLHVLLILLAVGLLLTFAWQALAAAPTLTCIALAALLLAAGLASAGRAKLDVYAHLQGSYSAGELASLKGCEVTVPRRRGGLSFLLTVRPDGLHAMAGLEVVDVPMAVIDPSSPTFQARAKALVESLEGVRLLVIKEPLNIEEYMAELKVDDEELRRLIRDRLEEAPYRSRFIILVEESEEVGVESASEARLRSRLAGKVLMVEQRLRELSVATRRLDVEELLSLFGGGGRPSKVERPRRALRLAKAYLASATLGASAALAGLTSLAYTPLALPAAAIGGSIALYSLCLLRHLASFNPPREDAFPLEPHRRRELMERAMELTSLLPGSYELVRSRGLDYVSDGRRMYAYVKVVGAPSTYAPVSGEEVRARVGEFNALIASDRLGARLLIVKPEAREELEEWLRRVKRRREFKYRQWTTGDSMRAKDEAFRLDELIQRVEGPSRESLHKVAIMAEVEAPVEGGRRLAEAGLRMAVERVQARLKYMGFEAELVRGFEVLEAFKLFRMPVSRVEAPYHYVLSMDIAHLTPLSLPRRPDPKLFSRGLWLGVDRLGGLVFWNPDAVPNDHCVILGPMGTGKTTTLRHIAVVARRMRGLPVWIIDPAGEYVRAVERLGGRVVNLAEAKVNPLLLAGREPASRASSVADLLSYSVGLNEVEAALVNEAILSLYREAGVVEEDPSTWDDSKLEAVTIASLYEALRSRLSRELDPTRRLIIQSALGKLAKLAVGARAFNSTGVRPWELLGETCCFVLRDLDPDARKVAVWTLLEQLYDYLYAHGGFTSELRLMVVIDEAHLFIKPELRYAGGRAYTIDPPLFRHMRLMRKFGVGYWVCTHIPEDVPDEVWKTCGTFIIFASSERDYLDFVASKMNLSEEDVAAMQFFGRGEAFIRWYGDPRPAYLKVIPHPLALS